MICVFRFALSQQCWGNCPGFVFKAKISESITDSGIKQCLYKLFALLCRDLLNEKTKSMLSPGNGVLVWLQINGASILIG